MFHKCAQNLLSVSQLNKSGAIVNFLPENSEIRDSGQKFPVILVVNIFKDEEICYLHSTYTESLSPWHQKLGHLNFPAVISFLRRLGIKVDRSRQNLFCRLCAQAKLIEKRFTSRYHLVRNVLGRVHSDIGGPI